MCTDNDIKLAGVFQNLKALSLLVFKIFLFYDMGIVITYKAFIYFLFYLFPIHTNRLTSFIIKGRTYEQNSLKGIEPINIIGIYCFMF